MQQEAHREDLEKRKTQHFCSMDTELRQLRQELLRLRVEWESEMTQRDNAETSMLKLTQANGARAKALATREDLV